MKKTHKTVLKVANFYFLYLFFTFSPCQAQVQDDFSDGNISENPTWLGDTAYFRVNEEGWLQSKADSDVRRAIFTSSQAIDDALWQVDVRINYTTSATNYACIYLITNTLNADSCDAYYVQIGNTDDEISLWRQMGTKKTKIIDGANKRIDYQPVILTVKVTRDSGGNFELYIQKPDSDFVMEGTVQDLSVTQGNYFGLLYKNTTTTKTAYLFDNVNVTGNPPPYVEPSLKPEEGDIVWNEVMFDVADNLVEYVEIANVSDKRLDISGVKFATAKSDATYNTFVIVPNGTCIEPESYAVFCNDIAKVRNYFHLPENAPVFQTSRWNALNNEGGTLILKTATDQMLDSMVYSTKWHHALITNSKNVALEKINPALPSYLQSSWHSAAYDVNYGTPCVQNSQFRTLAAMDSEQNLVWLETEHFSPDNDGYNDLCYIRYTTDLNGATATAVIFDAVGNRVNTLIDNALLSSDGYIVWNGTRTDGKLANVGVYMLYFQYYSVTNAKKSTVKLPIVLTSR